MFKALVLFISSLLEKPFPPNLIIQDRFQIIKHLGSGSYGHSYHVYDKVQNRKVVLKALRIHKRMTKRGRDGFSLEMTIQKKLLHPGLPKFMTKGSHEKIPFFIMEFIEGKTFEQLIFEEGKTYSERECFIIAYELLEILEYIHHERIVHRDIRIPNIMMENGRIKVIDMGLAKVVQENGNGKNAKYQHPRKRLDFQSDFYGLGHFLLFLLYSKYTPPENGKEGSWEEELILSDKARLTIRKLLQIDPPYKHCLEIKQDFQMLLNIPQVKG